MAAHGTTPTLTARDLTTYDGHPGLHGTFYLKRDANGNYSEPVEEVILDDMNALMTDTELFFNEREWYLVVRGKLHPRSTKTTFRFGLTVAGRAKLFVDDKMAVDNWSSLTFLFKVFQVHSYSS